MKLKMKVWIITFLLFIVGSSACALNNKIVIKSSESLQSSYFRDGFEFRFPDSQHIQIEPMYGASWQISGDISDVIQSVVTDIYAFDFHGLSSQKNSYMQIQDIKILYQDILRDGADSTLSVGLDLQFIGKYNGVYVESCQLGRIIPERSPPIHHGLFASRDQMRTMIQPVYEELIKEALSQALITGLNCLSNKSEVEQMN